MYEHNGRTENLHNDFYKYTYTSGFWPRVCARALRAPVFLGSVTWKTGHCAPPYRSFAAPSPPQKNNYFQKQNASL